MKGLQRLSCYGFAATCFLAAHLLAPIPVLQQPEPIPPAPIPSPSPRPLPPAPIPPPAPKPIPPAPPQETTLSAHAADVKRQTVRHTKSGLSQSVTGSPVMADGPPMDRLTSIRAGYGDRSVGA